MFTLSQFRGSTDISMQTILKRKSTSPFFNLTLKDGLNSPLLIGAALLNLIFIKYLSPSKNERMFCISTSHYLFTRLTKLGMGLYTLEELSRIVLTNIQKWQLRTGNGSNHLTLTLPLSWIVSFAWDFFLAFTSSIWKPGERHSYKKPSEFWFSSILLGSVFLTPTNR